MIKSSVIICYNNISKLNEAIYYLEKQTMYDEIEIIALDNREGQFTSASKALNYAANKAQGQVLIFMHQDVYLWDLETIEKYYQFLSDKDNVIAGAAGCAKPDGVTYSDIYETKNKIRRVNLCDGKIIPAYSLDECFFAMSRVCWSNNMFDEETCDDWHLYAVDICYSNILRGGSNVILPVEICHESLGNPNNRKFHRCAKRVINKYKGKIDMLYGTCIKTRATCSGWRQRTLSLTHQNVNNISGRSKSH